MKKTVLLFCLFLVSYLSIGQTKNFLDQPYLETKAKVDTLVKPDLIYLNILLREKDNKNRTSVEELEQKMAKSLEDIGIDLKKQLTLSDLASNFKKYFLKRKEVLKSKSYKLKVFDAQTAGKVMVILEDIGISNVSLGATEYSKIEALKLKLKSKAVKKAKLQAEYLVKPLNQKVSEALYISDTYYQAYYHERDMEEMVLAYNPRNKNQITPLEIDFKPIQVEAEVTIRFKLE